jgi:hypothetical protein
VFRLPGERARSSPLAFGDVTFAVAVLDDYQGVARSFGPWDALDADVTFFADHVDGDDALAERLAPFDAVVAMRERTPFGAALLARLPRLRLLVTTGMATRRSTSRPPPSAGSSCAARAACRARPRS